MSAFVREAFHSAVVKQGRAALQLRRRVHLRALHPKLPPNLSRIPPHNTQRLQPPRVSVASVVAISPPTLFQLLLQPSNIVSTGIPRWSFHHTILESSMPEPIDSSSRWTEVIRGRQLLT